MLIEIANGLPEEEISDINLRPLGKKYDDNKNGQQMSLFKDDSE